MKEHLLSLEHCIFVETREKITFINIKGHVGWIYGIIVHIVIVFVISSGITILYVPSMSILGVMIRSYDVKEPY